MDDCVAEADGLCTTSSDFFPNTSASTAQSNETLYIPYSSRLETYLVPSLFILIFIVGVVGNGTLILIFLRHRQMRNVPNIYIFSLALGDLLVILTCVPFISIIYTFESWPWGEDICKLSETTKDVSVGVSVFTLTALSVERYYAIVRPMSRHMTTKLLAVVTASGIWVVSLVLAAPAWLFSHCQLIYILEKKAHISVCTPFWSQTHGRLMVTIQFFVYYLIPIAVIGVFYSLMARHLFLSTKCLPGEHGKVQNSQILARKKVAIMVLAFVMIFAVCFFPQRVFMLWFYYSPDSESDYNEFWHAFRILGFCLAFLNSCVNPIALYMISNAFRKYFDHYLICRPYRKPQRFSFPTTNCSSITCKQNSILLTSLRGSHYSK